MIEKLLALIGERFPLAAQNCDKFAEMKVSGMKFSISAYEAKGLGHVSVMRAVGMMGLMKMDTLIINPTEIDLPLYSYDRIFAMGNDTLIVELYDTLLTEYSESALLAAKDAYADLPERDPGEHWYDSIKLASSISKKGKKKHLSRMNDLAFQHFEAYIDSDASAVSDNTAKQSKAAVYVDGLFELGGPSTDVLTKAIGQEKTAELFNKVLFGLAE